MKYKVILVEDDPLSAQILSDMISDCFDEIEVVAFFSNVKEAIAGIQNTKVDIVFLDVELPDGNGFDVLAGLTAINFEVVITTLYDSFMLQAIKHSAIDYILKPITQKSLTEAVERFKIRHQKSRESKQTPSSAPSNRLVIPNQEGLILVDISSIVRLESDGAYTNLYLTNGQKHMTSKNLGFYQGQLEPYAFFRVHHSHIINIAHIKNYVRGEGGHVVMTDNSLVTVSRRRKEEFLITLGA